MTNPPTHECPNCAGDNYLGHVRCPGNPAAVRYLPRPGRPTTGTRIAVRLPADVLSAVDRIATATATTRAAVLRRIIAKHVSQEKP